MVESKTNLKTIKKNDLNIVDIINLVKTNVFSNINCHNVGKILEFDKETQTCTVEIMQVKQFGENYYYPAPITQVPLIIAGAGNGHITMPDPTGTICILLFMDRNIDNFLETGESYVPDTARMHDFTDCIALTTFKTLANPIENYDDKAITIWNEEIIEEVKQSSTLKLYSNQILIENSLGGQISIDDKLSLKNTNQDLLLLINELLTACESIAVNPDTGVILDSSKQLFTDLKTKFGELLK